MEISGKTAIVTGATSGIGLGIATALAATNAAPIDYRRAGRSGQAMATRDESPDEAVA